jgi:hypothetical protein
MEDNSNMTIAVKESIEQAVKNNNMNQMLLVIREDDPLKVYEEIPTKISGILNSPLMWLQKRVGKHDILSSHIIVDRDRMSIELITEERDHFRNSIVGKLEYHPAFIKFGINSGNYITTHEMADKIKMNRSFFESKSDAMVLVSTLKNFKAKIDSEIERNNDNRGNVKAFVQQTVSSNLPNSFNMVMPIFKGEKPMKIEVEVYIEADDLKCTLISPEANEEMERLRDHAINTVLSGIEAICPEIVVIEK